MSDPTKTAIKSAAKTPNKSGASTVRTDGRARASSATTDGKPSRLPWVRGGIDYGPAILAIDELATWVFDLARANVADWPEGQRHVNAAHKKVRAALSGKRSIATGDEDVAFTASLVVRILDADLDLGLSDVVTILDEMGLPTEEAAAVAPRRRSRPQPKRRPSIATVPPAPSASTDDGTRLAHVIAIMDALSSGEVDLMRRQSELRSPGDHDTIVGHLCRLSVADAVAWVRTELLPSTPTPLRPRERVIRVVPLGPACAGCPGAHGFQRIA